MINGLVGKVASSDGTTLKVTELFSKARLHGRVLDFIHLSATSVAETA